MLDLDSPKWKELKHAYGSAANIPDLLRQLPAAPVGVKNSRAEPWYALWSSLCHQQDIYTASFAAVPHLVSNAALKPPAQRWDFVLMVSSIEVCRHRSDAPAIPPELAQDYFDALGQMRRLTWECLELKLNDEDDAKVFLSGLAIMDGFPQLGNAVVEIPEPNVCPVCEADVPPFGYELE